MAKAKSSTKKTNVNNTINIKSLPVQCHIGASKFVNDDWGTIAFSIPRNQIQNKFADPELRYNFIYFLFGYENSKEVVYVGQAKKRNNGESVLARLREHDTSTTEKYKDKWTWIIAVTNKNDAWGLDDLNALEHAFYTEVPADQNLNGNNPNSGGADYEAYTDKISQIKSLITAVGFSIFSDEETTEKIQVTSEVNEYTVVEDLHNGMARIPEIVTPQKVVKAMVDMLPAEVWNSKTKFLDPACKGGEYLREVYDRLMETEILQSEFPNTIERSNHILKNQIYGIALSQVSLERTTKKLLGEDRNIRVIPNYINKLKGIDMGSRPDGRQNNISDILNKEFGKDMKFDVVIGNPPYQESTGEKARAVPIYQRFVNNGFDLADTVCMITPARWFSASDNSSKDMRKHILSDNTSCIFYHEKSAELFNGVSINGGISYFCTNKNRHGLTSIIINGTKDDDELITDNTIFIPSNAYRKLTQRVIKTKKFIDNTDFSQNMFGLDTNYFGLSGNLKVRTSSGLSDYINDSDIKKGVSNIHKYKVITGSMNTSSIINNPEILDCNTVCTRTYTVLGVYNTLQDAQVVKKYFMTKFVRALIDATLNNQMVSHDNYNFVPLQDFTSNSDIDWSQSIQEIDQQLYKKYNLTEEEIAYIEQTIKPMA